MLPSITHLRRTKGKSDWRVTATSCFILLSWFCPTAPVAADDFFEKHLKPVFETNCAECHGRTGDAMGGFDLTTVRSADDLAGQPELLKTLVDVLDDHQMPPEDGTPLEPVVRRRLVAGLKKSLQAAIATGPNAARTPIRRMNRFQYNNAVQDLFQLNVVIFPLPERMLREHGAYFQPQTGKMPDQVRVGSRPLGKSQLIEARLADVTSFPQDLRAEYGFDNQADQLTLSPLLLESFLRLSRSIVDSPDFNAKTCGIWNTFFKEPLDEDPQDTSSIVQTRLQEFLTRAFRRPVEDELLDRYASYVMARLETGDSFTEVMKSVAAAAIASPRFLYLYDQRNDTADQIDDFALASRLSFFLWASIPDKRLLERAAEGRLREAECLAEEVGRMLNDQRLKRFCDSFPVQWLQLERIISSTPDPQRFPQFYFSKYRASMHMMLEPLLLFETVLIENLSILNFIDSEFSYRSDLLRAWYRDGSAGRPGPPTVVNFQRVPITDRRQGGIITNAAVMTMTSGPTRTQPITRGAWIAGVILNDPPEPPPADVPPLAEEPSADEETLTLRERFAAHRTRADCAACHQLLDPLGFALENYDAAGIWREAYDNGRTVDPSGTLLGKHEFSSIAEFKDVLLAEKGRFTRAFASHLLTFALARQLKAEDTLELDRIVQNTADDHYRFQTLIQQIVQSELFLR